jgi:hypothetical protein
MNTDAHVVPHLQRDDVDRLADAFDGPADGRQHGVAVNDAVNDPPDTDPEKDEGPPQRPRS